MKTKIITLFITCFIISNVIAQKNLNKYKYVIVPYNYNFLKEKDQYQLNTLTQFLFNKYGFNAIMEGEDYPDDLKFNRCSALKADVNKDSGMFKTRLTVSLKDCNDRIVYTSDVGESREKEFKIAYNKALREAFLSIEALNYKYESSHEVTTLPATAAVKSEATEEVQALKQDAETLKNKTEVESAKVVNSVAVPVVAVAAASEVSTTPKKEKTLEEGVKEMFSGILYAQEIENGYQLVDSSPKVVYKLKNTELDNLFLVENKGAIVFKKGDDWVVKYYENNTWKEQTLNIKF
jgi:hypothetical protein